MVFLWEYKWLQRLPINRFCFDKRSEAAAEQEVHRFGIGFVIESSDKVDSVAADLFILVIPQVSPDGHLFRAVTPLPFTP